MALRHSREAEISRYGADEGAGRAFDLADMSASAEREIWVTGNIREVLDWYEQQLIALGWRRWTELPPEMQRPDDLPMIRGSDESFSVHIPVYPPGEYVVQSGERTWGRVSYLVQPADREVAEGD